MLSSLATGLGFGFSLIVAIGAQNAHVLRQGLRREHVGVVVAICALSDLVLIALGTAGIGSVIAAHRSWLQAISVVGAVVLGWYAIVALRRAIHPGVLVAELDGEPRPLLPVALVTMGLTWLNPHVYLDTVVLLGSVAGTQPSRWAFATGAMIASLVWFSGLGFGAAVLRPVFAKPVAWRVFDLIVAAIMATLAVGLVGSALNG